MNNEFIFNISNNIDIGGELKEIENSIDLTMYINAVLNSILIIESLLIQLYNQVNPFLTAEQKQKILDVEKKISANKPLIGLELGKLIRLYSETKILNEIKRISKLDNMNFLNLPNLRRFFKKLIFSSRS